MLEGLKIVVSYFALTLILAIPLGVVVMALRLSKNSIISSLTSLYILIMRGTPLLLQMIVIYYGLPLIGIVFDRFESGIIAFALNYAAYFAEIFRGGILTIDKGQYEASKVLGFKKVTMYRRIIIPQVIKNILPPMSNEIITLVKDTSLVYILGLNDILRVAQIASNREASLMPLAYAGIIYLLMIAVITKILQIVEKKYSYYKK
ncbi:MAG: amino acid ABC transporter permease [Clostridioides sp.]|jgi:polar amino acid transport system permease protein|nr:amino acid ABC transporter permease [Clostridioides sp.]